MNKRKSAIEHTSRSQLIDRVRSELEHRGYPRLQMLLLVSLTGGAGFLASYVLLHAGFETLSGRYGLSVAIAYVFFLLLLWLWLRTDAGDSHDLGESLVDVADAVLPRGRRHGHYHDASSESPVDLSSVGDLSDADEFAIPLGIVLAVVALVATVLAASFSIVYSAPVLFAELLVDGVLSATLYRRLRRLDSRHWLQSAVRRTFVPFAITALLMMAAGWGLSSYAPTARSLGEVLATR